MPYFTIYKITLYIHMYYHFLFAICVLLPPSFIVPGILASPVDWTTSKDSSRLFFWWGGGGEGFEYFSWSVKKIICVHSCWPGRVSPRAFFLEMFPEVGIKFVWKWKWISCPRSLDFLYSIVIRHTKVTNLCICRVLLDSFLSTYLPY